MVIILTIVEPVFTLHLLFLKVENLRGLSDGRKVGIAIKNTLAQCNQHRLRLIPDFIADYTYKLELHTCYNN